MTILEILVAPDVRLKTRADEVVEVNDNIRTKLSDMVETMYEFNGVGLAATQVGIMQRLIVMDCANTEEGETSRLVKFVNPEIIEMSDETNDIQEGCLSVPGFYETLNRPDRCKVKYLDENGVEQISEYEGLESVCIQHEIEHLNGDLFIDSMSKLRRDRITKKLQKLKKAGAVFHQRKTED